VQATERQALNRARDLPRLGTFVARLDVPADAAITWEKTLGRGHYTIWGDAEQLLGCVGAVVPVQPID
jgi:hypothetical protein